MGNVPSLSFENRGDKIRKLEEKLKKLEEEKEKEKGTYWKCHESVWDKQLEKFEGYFARYKGVRKGNSIEHYVDLQCLLEHSEGGEAVLERLHEGSVYDATDPDAESVSTRATDYEIDPGRGDNAGTKNHSKKHLKTIRGNKICETNKSKAHLLPNDPVCNDFWLPVLQMNLGNTADTTGAPAKALEWAARTHTNKLVFDMEHDHFFDDLEYGNILAIPLFESFEGLGQWNYKQPYEMLIVCNRSEAYKQVRIGGDEKHVEMASGEDVQRATQLLSTATKILADSLLVNSDFYDNAGDGSGESQKRKKMMEKMRKKLSTGEVYVPSYKLGNQENPKLYKVKFGDLYTDEEARKYIPDPLLLLIKAAVNLSGHHYSKTCKLLPACMSVSSEESEVPLITLQSPKGSTDIAAAFSEIRIVSDEEDDDVSACSDITYSSV